MLRSAVGNGTKAGGNIMLQKPQALDFLILFVLVLLLPLPAHAYIDPGIGSAMTTAVLGLFAAIAYAFRTYVYRARNFMNG